jgi:hypothetical protein
VCIVNIKGLWDLWDKGHVWNNLECTCTFEAKEVPYPVRGDEGRVETGFRLKAIKDTCPVTEMAELVVTCKSFVYIPESGREDTGEYWKAFWTHTPDEEVTEHPKFEYDGCHLSPEQEKDFKKQCLAHAPIESIAERRDMEAVLADAMALKPEWPENSLHAVPETDHRVPKQASHNSVKSTFPPDGVPASVYTGDDTEVHLLVMFKSKVTSFDDEYDTFEAILEEGDTWVEKASRVPFVVVYMEEVPEHANKMAARGFIPQPVMLEQLKSAITNIGLTWKELVGTDGEWFTKIFAGDCCAQIKSNGEDYEHQVDDLMERVTTMITRVNQSLQNLMKSWRVHNGRNGCICACHPKGTRKVDSKCKKDEHDGRDGCICVCYPKGTLIDEVNQACPVLHVDKDMKQLLADLENGTATILGLHLYFISPDETEHGNGVEFHLEDLINEETEQRYQALEVSSNNTAGVKFLLGYDVSDKPVSDVSAASDASSYELSDDDANSIASSYGSAEQKPEKGEEVGEEEEEEEVLSDAEAEDEEEQKKWVEEFSSASDDEEEEEAVDDDDDSDEDQPLALVLARLLGRRKRKRD